MILQASFSGKLNFLNLFIKTYKPYSENMIYMTYERICIGSIGLPILSGHSVNDICIKACSDDVLESNRVSRISLMYTVELKYS